MNLPQCISTKLTAGILAAVTMITPALAVTGTVNADGGLRMRTGAGTQNGIITTLPNGTKVDVTAVTESGWYQISYHNTMGYVAGEYIVLNQEQETAQVQEAAQEQVAEASAPEVVAETVYGKVTEGPLNVRSTPSTSGNRVKQLHAGRVVEILEQLDGWYKIEGGYISANYVRIVDAAEAQAANNASAVVDYAMQFLGYPYVYGGTSPRGFDCSGFVKYVFAHFGVNINRTASDQMSNGTKVSMSELLPGDVVFFKKPGSSARLASHVGIYIGGGQFIHASTSTTGVIISDMDYAYYTTGFVGGRRMM